ncbi:hypothetical protein CGZ80_20290 [Rhodopirellula sp. MGV]|nr:hypothetical protein CGZ80_20290 [Rhodopirellula sp. MGV]PNY38008.1 hypothetical protein C2E31_04825 [Rhodopirellula baltica]
MHRVHRSLGLGAAFGRAIGNNGLEFARFRMLLKLGVRRDEAISHGSSCRGPWVMSSSATMDVAISIDSL